ncbi:MAG TPA: hypothetical protein PLD47_15225 [Aggregatilineales bacterium]|nr:hypothetical protein [Aggregatilineales bacterium]
MTDSPNPTPDGTPFFAARARAWLTFLVILVLTFALAWALGFFGR